MNAEFDHIYTEATEPFKSELKLFRQTHTLKAIDVKGNKWKYFASGQGDEVLLALHGGGGPAESLFRYLVRFEENYRVIAPTVPASAHRVAEVVDAILEILDKEAVPAVHIFGVSNGGMIGQCFVRQHPQRVISLILFHTMLPSADYAKVFGKHAGRLSILPRWITVTVGQKWVIKQLQSEESNAEPGEIEFWKAYFKELYRSELVTKEYFVSRAQILTDYFQNYQFLPDDLTGWNGGVLILESQNDQVVNELERERLKHFYCQAKVHTFMGSGHLSGGLFETEETVELVNDFIEVYDRPAVF
jgi:pimeloyl-ACP methyl ester carboxylesterase